MKSTDIISRMKSHHGLKSDAKVGIVSSFGKGAEVDLKADTRDITAIVNTNDIDLESEVVEASGANPKFFLKNRQVFGDHKYEIENGVGVLRKLSPHPSTADHRAWKMRIRVNDNPIGNAVLKIVQETGQIGFSVGFIATDAGQPTDEERVKFGGDNPENLRTIVRAWDWFETSATLLPCNVSCQSLDSVESKSLDMLNAVDNMVVKGLIGRDIASLLGAPITSKRKIYTVPSPKPRYLVTADGDQVRIRA